MNDFNCSRSNLWHSIQCPFSQRESSLLAFEIQSLLDPTHQIVMQRQLSLSISPRWTCQLSCASTERFAYLPHMHVQEFLLSGFPATQSLLPSHLHHRIDIITTNVPMVIEYCQQSAYGRRFRYIGMQLMLFTTTGVCCFRATGRGLIKVLSDQLGWSLESRCSYGYTNLLETLTRQTGEDQMYICSLTGFCFPIPLERYHLLPIFSN